MPDQRLEFIVEGSRGDQYRVTDERTAENLNVFCTCKAGEDSLYCKHRFALFDGDTTNLQSGNEDYVGLLQEMLNGTDVELALNDVKRLDMAHEDARKALGSAKRALAKAMYG